MVECRQREDWLVVMKDLGWLECWLIVVDQG